MIGRRLAHYDITAHLGSGGMGDVYQATDTKLGRSVALKFLPEAFMHDAERAVRFKREARTLASLNHSHIAAIYGLEESDRRSFLVMEFVPGQTLSERIARKPVPLDEALGIALQIAEAIEAAHEKGIVHRDLKPANVKITPDGQVKVLDFGLAKFAAGEESRADEPGRTDGDDPTNSPTIVSATNEGVILGTAAYMAPEQAKGRPVDARSDIFAFGCVLYEMLTGRPAFEGENVPEILSRVLQRDPDWTRVPPNVPPSIHRLMRLCLEKDPRKRRQAAGDVRIDLEQALVEPAPALQDVRGRSRSRFARQAGIVVAALAVMALAVPAVLYFRTVSAPELRLQIVTPPTSLPLHFALSPDGRYIVFVGSGSSGDTRQLYLRALDKSDPQPLAGTEGALYPFWSPDNRSVGFFASEKLLRIDITGGPPQELAPAANPQGGAWSTDGTILFAPNSVSPLLRVAASGGESAAATKLDPPHVVSHRLPSFLPNGRQFLFYAQGEPEVKGIYLGSLDGGVPKRLTDADTAGAYLAPDKVVFVRKDALVAYRLDSQRGELTGDPLTLAVSVGRDETPLGGFSVSATGTVAHRAGSNPVARMTWFDRNGKVLETGPVLNAPDLSRDGRRVTFDRTFQANRDVWIMNLDGSGLTRFTFDGDIDGFPIWSPDDSRIAFESNRKGTFDIWIKPSSGAGTEQILLEGKDNEWPLHWSRDGRFLLYQESDLKTVEDLLALPMTGNDRTPIVVANTHFAERMGEFSPDGRWVAYGTQESGTFQIVVQAFPEPGIRHQVSKGGGQAPRWSADGKEIYFVAPDGKMMAAPVKTAGSTFEAGTPVALFSTRIVAQVFKFQYAVSRDGRFLAYTSGEDTAPSPITLILNRKL